MLQDTVNVTFLLILLVIGIIGCAIFLWPENEYMLVRKARMEKLKDKELKRWEGNQQIIALNPKGRQRP